MAYGGRGLSYYTYVVPIYADCGDAAYDKYGFKTPVWTYIAHMNYAIHNIGVIYKDFDYKLDLDLIDQITKDNRIDDNYNSLEILIDL